MTQRTVGASLDTVLDTLGDSYRRRVLVALLDHESRNGEAALRPGDGPERRIRMRHLHLPKLEAEGFVEWDRETNDVRRGRRFDEIRPLLELLSEHGDELPDDWI